MQLKIGVGSMVFSNVTRKQAFLAHLAASMCLFVILLYLIVFQWFPEFYFYLDGGIRAIGTLFFVDVVLGPGLTLLVFKPGKKSLKFDMAVILLLQLSALTWGINNVYTERSGSAVFYWGKFSCLANNITGDMNMVAITAGPSGRQRLSFLQRPDTAEGVHAYVKESFMHGTSEIYYFGEKIVPMDELVVSRLNNYQLDLTALAKENKAVAKEVGDYIERHQADMWHIKLVPLSCRFGSAIAAYDMNKLKIIDYFEIDRKISLRAQAQDEPLPFNSLLDEEDELIQY